MQLGVNLHMFLALKQAIGISIGIGIYIGIPMEIFIGIGLGLGWKFIPTDPTASQIISNWFKYCEQWLKKIRPIPLRTILSMKNMILVQTYLYVHVYKT